MVVSSVLRFMCNSVLLSSFVFIWYYLCVMCVGLLLGFVDIVVLLYACWIRVSYCTFWRCFDFLLLDLFCGCVACAFCLRCCVRVCCLFWVCVWVFSG